MQQTGHPPNPFAREREDLRQRLMDRSEKGDFAAFWRGQRLIGLYYLSGDVIDVLAVHPNFHHAGYGTVLIQHAARQVLQARGYPVAYLFVVAANEGARRLYLRLGFEISGFYSENTYAGINC
jgi:GNAT superfamily N-acetyltransferase